MMKLGSSSVETAPKAVRFTCYGHPAIRALHSKSLELTSHGALTKAGTCIIGIKARLPFAALCRLRGMVAIELRAGEVRECVTATMNRFYADPETLIIRTSRYRSRATFAVAADRAAADLDRRLVEYLQNENNRLEVTIREVQPQPDEPVRGLLVLVPTPLGNMRDMTLRALDELARADVIAAEDTRTARELLRRYGIRAPLVSCHDFNERRRTRMALALLEQGKRIALVSEAGTPAISDPGFKLVQAAIAVGHEVTCLPGASALLVALAASGLASDRFTFLGFLPRTSVRRRTELASLSRLPFTLIFYEAPHRIRQCLDDMAAVLGDRDACVARELTKPYEQFIRGRLSEIRRRLDDDEILKGEFTLVVAGAQRTPMAMVKPEIDERISALLQDGVHVKEIRDRLLGEGSVSGSKHDLYQKILQLKRKVSEPESA